MDFAWPAGAAERLWSDPTSWPAWVEGFARVVRSDGEWPTPGSVVEWQSGPSGRGDVRERVAAHEPGASVTTEFSDDRMRGTQHVEFEPLEGGVAVSLELEYTLTGIRFGALALDALFVRRAIRDSLRRTLQRFGRELAAQRL
jgi:uncharacterized membrane protein